MISHAVVVPSPPLLVPQLAGTAAEIEPTRAAAIEAAAELARVSSRWIVVAADSAASRWGPSTTGTFAGFGVDVRVALGPGASPDAQADRLVPLPILISGWLREAVGGDHVSIEGRVLPDDSTGERCAHLGAQLAAEFADVAEPIALLVVADGATTHTARAPGAFHPDAEAFDRSIARALGCGDTTTLATLDPARCADLRVGGRVGWQVLARAMGEPTRTRLLHSSAPLGVGYHVASWIR